MFLFSPVSRPDPIRPDSTLDEELQKAADEADLTLYMINMVVVSATDLANMDMAIVDKSDPYCVVTIGELSDRTPTIQNDLNPVWNEQMSFFLPKKPEKMLITVYDEDNYGKDDVCGTGEFEFGSFFEIGGVFQGDVKLTLPDGETKKGSVQIHLKCRTLKPVETEIKLGYAQRELECLGKEKEATVAALDESEELRKKVVGELDSKEREILAKAAALAKEIESRSKDKEEAEATRKEIEAGKQRAESKLTETVAAHSKELSAKEQELLDKAQEIEAKVQEKEEAEVARREAEAKKRVAETKLTEAEKQILEQADLLEEKERTNTAALTDKEKEILAMADQLEVKEQASKNAQQKLAQVEALKVEVENELTAKERIIQEQAKQIELKAKENDEALSKKDKEILEQAKELEARDAAAQAAQKKQDEAMAELEELRKQNRVLQDKVSSEQATMTAEEQARCGCNVM